MFIRTSGLVPATASGGPSSLLKLVAGEFAAAVDRLWPAPHTPFLTAPAARRHLACVALAIGRDLAGRAEALLAERLRRLIPALVPEAPAGLERALGRLGEVAWPADDYRRLLRLLEAPRATKVLRHAEAIPPELVRRLDRLPPAMAEAVGLAFELHEDGVAAVREAYDALRSREGLAVAERAAERWARTGSARALFEAVRDDLCPEPAAPPHSGTRRLRPLATKRDLRDAARRYRNCLADRMPYAATGWSAFYEWEGPPGAVVELARDPLFGWRLEEVRTLGNGLVAEPYRDALVDELALMGVHVGRAGWELDRALRPDVGHGWRLRPADAARSDAFGGD
ncbi:hypothetical protein [Phenylobacterium sp.]|uniref:hypothetical protein n=1 Tax=Phenylobacterium sp. TaxID=1871053 RepID=UPI0035B44EB9